MSAEVLIEVDDVSKKFCRSLKKSLVYGFQDVGTELLGRTNKPILRSDEFWAIKDVSFQIRRGECLGLIGPNGAGKSTLLKLLNGLIMPNTGSITVRGNMRALIELGAGFDPVLTGLENIYNQAAIHGMSHHEVNQKLDKILAFADIGDFIHTPVQNYSSGMRVRLGFAIAAQMEPDILILDEVLAVGDAGFRAKCYSAISEIVKSAAVIFVSHSMAHMSRLAQDCLVLDKGKVHFIGKTESAVIEYQKLCSRSGSDPTQENFLADSKENAERFGSQEVSIKQLKIIDKSGEESQIFSYGDPVKMTLSIKSEIDVESLVVDIGFYTMENEVAAECNNFVKAELISIQAGETISVELVIPEMTLNPGAYKLSALLLSHNMTTHFDWMKHFIDIEVRDARSAIAHQQFKALWQVSHL